MYAQLLWSGRSGILAPLAPSRQRVDQPDSQEWKLGLCNPESPERI